MVYPITMMATSLVQNCDNCLLTVTGNRTNPSYKANRGAICRYTLIHMCPNPKGSLRVQIAEISKNRSIQWMGWCHLPWVPRQILETQGARRSRKCFGLGDKARLGLPRIGEPLGEKEVERPTGLNSGAMDDGRMAAFEAQRRSLT